MKAKAWSSLAVCALLCGLPWASSAGEEPGARARAIELYDAGRYAEALPLLQQLDGAGSADGPLLYRLYYCQNQARDPAARETLRRSIAKMEEESAAGEGLEAPFYLVNAYQRVARLSDMKRIAGETTTRVESGSLAEPTTPIGMFRLGKLYDDQERSDAALGWYTRALEGARESDTALPEAYVAWASRRVAESARESGDDTALEASLTQVAESGSATLDDLDLLAITRLRLGRYREAADAWGMAVRAEPARADRARYCGSLARMASELAELPAAAPDGRAWSELSGSELEQQMLERATEVRERVAAAAQPGQRPSGDERTAIAAMLSEQHARFVAAGLEYAKRGLDLRQAAFSGGYAPMVFHAKRWRLPGR